jgi:ribulose-bisphosphate carboxylase large chain
MSHHYHYSGDRFIVTYELTGDQNLAQTKAESICVEQTIEFPVDLVTSENIKKHVIGRLENLKKVGEDYYRAEISYAVEITGFEIVQLLNVLFGNTSIKPGIKVVSLELPESMQRAFQGPRYGPDGLRHLLNVPSRPLLCAAVKPMGLSAHELANIAHDYAMGGVDLIKEDHGLANQSFSPFEERVKQCAEAVAEANQKTGNNSIYLPNIPGPTMDVLERAYYAKQNGAGGLLVAPGLLGFDVMRALADDDDLALPIMCHPAMLGSFTAGSYHGFSHYLLYGYLPRLAGADMVIFPVFGGRFSFSEDECEEIVDGCSVDLGPIKPAFPAPGGGLRIDQVPEMIEFFGSDVVFLIGGNLSRGGTPLENCTRFFNIVNQNPKLSR